MSELHDLLLEWPKDLKLDPDRPSVWYQPELDGWGIRPSSIGGCLRGLIACRLGDPGLQKTEHEEDVCNEGYLHEDWILARTVRDQERKTNKKWKLEKGPMIYLPVWDRYFIAGTLDGIMWSKGRHQVIGIDAKAQGESSWKYSNENGLSEDYDWQRSCYWYGLENLLERQLNGYVYARKCRNDAHMAYDFVTEPTHSWMDIVERVMTIHAYATNGRPSDVPCKNETPWCSWRHLHDYGLQVGGENVWRAGLSEQCLAIRKIDERLKELSPDPETKRVIEELKDEKDRLKQQVLDQCRELPVGKIQCGLHSVTIGQTAGYWRDGEAREELVRLRMDIRGESLSEARIGVEREFRNREGKRTVKVWGPSRLKEDWGE